MSGCLLVCSLVRLRVLVRLPFFLLRSLPRCLVPFLRLSICLCVCCIVLSPSCLSVGLASCLSLIYLTLSTCVTDGWKISHCVFRTRASEFLRCQFVGSVCLLANLICPLFATVLFASACIYDGVSVCMSARLSVCLYVAVFVCPRACLLSSPIFIVCYLPDALSFSVSVIGLLCRLSDLRLSCFGLFIFPLNLNLRVCLPPLRS